MRSQSPVAAKQLGLDGRPPNRLQRVSIESGQLGRIPAETWPVAKVYTALEAEVSSARGV